MIYYPGEATTHAEDTMTEKLHLYIISWRKTPNIWLLMLHFLIIHATRYIQIHEKCSDFSAIAIAYCSEMQWTKSLKHLWFFHLFDFKHIRFILFCVVFQQLVHDDLFQPKTVLFSTRALIWVHFKTVRYFYQPIFRLFSYLKNALHNLVIELCSALIFFQKFSTVIY